MNQTQIKFAIKRAQDVLNGKLQLLSDQDSKAVVKMKQVGTITVAEFKELFAAGKLKLNPSPRLADSDSCATYLHKVFQLEPYTRAAQKRYQKDPVPDAETFGLKRPDETYINKTFRIFTAKYKAKAEMVVIDFNSTVDSFMLGEAEEALESLRTLQKRVY